MSDDDEDEAAFKQGFKEDTKPVVPAALAVAAQQQPVVEKQQPPDPNASVEGKAADGQDPPGGATPPAEAKTPSRPPQNEGKAPKPAPIPGKLSADEIERLRALATKVPEQERQLSKAFGTIGELQQQLKTMRANGDARHEEPRPQPRLTGEALVVKRLQEQAMVDLEEDYPDWRDLVGASDTPDPNHPFRRWLSAKDAAYQHKINTSNSARAIAKAIDLFKSETARKAPPKVPQPANKALAADGDKAAAARRDRIANAVPPKTTAGKTPIRSRTDQDDFDEGFAQESR